MTTDIRYRLKGVKTLPKTGDKIRDDRVKALGEVISVCEKSGEVIARFKGLRFKKKAMPDETPEVPAEPAGQPLAADAQTASAPAPAPANQIEPFGAQVLRRIHEDTATLLADYDEMMGVLDNEGIRGHLTDHLKYLTKSLTQIERLFKKTYKQLPGIGDQQEEETPSELPDVETKDGEMMDSGVNAGASSSPEAPREEVMRGQKALEIEKKCLTCGKAGCACGGTKAMPGTALWEKQEVVEQQTEGAHLASASTDLEDHWALKPAEEEKVREATSFLKEIADPLSLWEDSHRMKSYHYHKALEPIGAIPSAGSKGMDKMQVPTIMDQVTARHLFGHLATTPKPVEDDPEVEAFLDREAQATERNIAGMKGEKASPKYSGGVSQDKKKQQASDAALRTQSKEQQDAAKLQPQQAPNSSAMDPEDYSTKGIQRRKSIAEASHFFKELSDERAFGDKHRETSLNHHSILEGLFNNTPPVNNAGGVDADDMWDYASFVQKYLDPEPENKLDGAIKELQLAFG